MPLGLSLGIGSALAGGVDYFPLVSSGVLHPSFTFTRSSSATYFDSAGVLQTATTNVPRIDYNPSTLALRGLLIEEARTNLLTYSEQFDDAAWIKGGVTVSANTTAAPAGVVTGDTVEVSVAGGSKSIREDKTVSALQYTFSVFVRAGTDSVLAIGIYQGGFVAQSATIISGPGTLGGGAGLKTISNLSSSEWTRIAVTSTAALSAAAASFYCYPGGAVNSVGDSLILWGAQLEAGAFATSYIPTTSAAVTRAADNAVNTTLSSIGYNAAEGTIYAEFTVEWDATTITRYISTIDAVGRHIYSSGTLTWANYDGVNLLAGPAGLGSGGINRTASTWGGATKAITTNGGAAVSGAFDGTMGAGSSFGVGNNGGSGILCGHIKTLRYYPRRLTDAQLAALTA